MVLISLVCSNMVANIIKIFETCKIFWPASEDFVNSATVFVNSATRRGGGASKPRTCQRDMSLADLPKTKPPSSSL